jgi:hypothetical protein
MKVALVFAGHSAAKSALLPYRSRRFVEGLAASGIDIVLVDLDIGQQSRFAPAVRDTPGITYYRNQVDRLPLIVAQERPALVQTFGATLDLGPVWSEGAKAQAPIVHFISSEGAIEEPLPALGLGFVRMRSTAQRVNALRARHASRRVAGLIGSNRADLGRHLRQGFFPCAQFSVVAPPPTVPPDIDMAAPVAAVERPVFGVYDPDASENTLRFLCRALDLTGAPGAFEVRVAPAALAALVPDRTAQLSFVEAADAADFLRGIDVLLMPEAQDRTLQTIVTALVARRPVIVPDTGAAVELVDYGRHGVLYAAGSAYHLAMAINVMTQSWSNRPFSFEGIEASIAKTTPETVARAFAAAYRRLAR